MTATRRRLLLAGAVGLCSAAFVACTAGAARGASGWDVRLFASLYAGQATRAPGGAGGSDSSAVHTLVRATSILGDRRTIVVVVLAVLVGLVWRGSGRDAAWVLLATSVCVSVPLLKAAVARPSPFDSPDGFSFPSGHAVGTMAVVLSILPVVRSTARKAAVALAGVPVVLAVGAAAVADGGHWPSDVVGGWLLALSWVGALVLLLRPGLRAPSVAPVRMVVASR